MNHHNILKAANHLQISACLVVDATLVSAVYWKDIPLILFLLMMDTKAASCCRRIPFSQPGNWIIYLSILLMFSQVGFCWAFRLSFICIPGLPKLLQQCINTVVFVVNVSILKELKSPTGWYTTKQMQEFVFLLIYVCKILCRHT